MNFYKWLIETKNWQIDEMPISNFQLMGQWGPDAKRAYGYSKQDIGILQSQKAVDKIKRKWSNTYNEFDFYFLRSNEARQQSDIGEVNPEWVKQNLQIDIQPNEDAITVIFTQNTGDEKIEMTAWTIAHRLGHVIRRNKTFELYFSQELLKDFRQLFEEVYGTKLQYNSANEEKQLRALAQAVGTMKSARTNNLRNFYEFMYELIAQWIITGKIEFNPIPRSLILRRKMAWGRPNHDTIGSKMNDIEHNEWSEMLQGYADKYEHYLDAIFSGLVGKMFVM